MKNEKISANAVQLVDEFSEKTHADIPFKKTKTRVIIDTETFSCMDEVAAYLVDTDCECPLSVSIATLKGGKGFVVERTLHIDFD